MRYILFYFLVVFILISCQSSHNPNQRIDSILYKYNLTQVNLPNGWKISPVGQSFPLGDLPLNVVISPSKQYVAVTNNGQSTHSIMLFDSESEVLLDEIELPKAWFGLAFDAEEKQLFASAGNDNMIKIFEINKNKLALLDSIVLGKPWPTRNNKEGEKISPAGITIDHANQLLYTVTKENNALYICDISSRSVLKKIDLEDEAYSCLLSPKNDYLYISMWGGENVTVFDTKAQKIVKKIPVESHPNDMVLTNDGNYLFVANSNSNSISVINTGNLKLIENISTALYPDAPTGSTTNGVALSDDEKSLYIANADNNYLAVFDISEPGQSKVKGFIPVGWYPTSVKVSGSKIFVSNGKGESSLPNPKGPNPYIKRDRNTQYIAAMFKGTLSIIDEPDEMVLTEFSQLVYDNTPYTKEKENLAEGELGNPIPRSLKENSSIKHVFYIIKENRTYDQIFGDILEGNGDSSLCLFPEFVTPNHHELARQFVLLDNFYVDAEVSADGHNWSTAAYATDYTEKTWPTSYGKRGGTYDYEGSREIAFPEKGHIWDYCQRANVTYRSYGEFVQNGKTKYPALENHIDPDYPSYNLSFKDIYRYEKWQFDFDSLLEIDQVPQFSSIRIGNDHTSGARLGMPTPKAMVADNDLALGKIVEHISKSKIWNKSAIFVVEDDAQNGPDHVDAHRSIALVISPFVKRNQVNHEMYSTSSVLRTMELILSLPPMSQYDAAANSMWRCFTSKPNFDSYTALKNNIDLDKKNEENNTIAKISADLNLTVEDAIPDILFNEIIWKSVKGENSIMPAPKRSAFVKLVD